MVRSRELYDVLGVEPSADIADIRKAYRIRALQCHPDKCRDDTSERFLAVQRAYEVLSDGDKRRLYDETGNAEDVSAADINFWTQRVVTEDEVQAFLAEYPGSETEIEDLVDFYNGSRGDVSLLLEFVIGSEPEDVPRLLGRLEEAMKEKKIEKLECYEESARKLRKRLPRLIKSRQRERQRFEEETEMESGVEALAVTLRERQRNRQQLWTSLADSLAEKYVEEKPKKKSRPKKIIKKDKTR